MHEYRPENVFVIGYNWGFLHSFVGSALPSKLLLLIFELYSLGFRIYVGFWEYSTQVFVSHVAMLVFYAIAKLRTDKMNKEFFDELSRSKEALVKFKDFLGENLTSGIIILNQAKTKVLFMNNSFKELLNIKDLATVFNILKEINIETQSAKEKKESLKLIDLVDQKNFCGQSTNCTYVDAGSNKKIYEARAFPLKWDREDAHAILLHDVSHQEAILTLKLDSQNKEKAISTVAHELRNPVNGILGITQIMEKNFIDPKVSHFVGILKTNVTLLLNILNSILDLNQIKANKINLNIKDIDLTQLIPNIKHLFKFQFVSKKIIFKSYIDPKVPRIIQTDQNRLSQILINLTANALKFTFRGSIALSIEPDPENSNKIIFKVSDTGIGIKQEDCAKLFQTFGKLQSSLDVNPEGVGLGLMISNSLVKVLNRNEDGAHIKVESKPEIGSTFSFSIYKSYYLESEYGLEEDESPRIIFDGNESKSYIELPEFQSVIKTIPASSKRSFLQNSQLNLITHSSLTSERTSLIKASRPVVLAVDDNFFNLLVLQEMAKGYDAICHTALNGQDAIDKVIQFHKKGTKIDLILMDFEMPVMDGLKACSILKEKMVAGEIPEIPIVGLSENQDKDIEIKSKQAGMNAYILKPLRESQFEKLLKEYCNCV